MLKPFPYFSPIGDDDFSEVSKYIGIQKYIPSDFCFSILWSHALHDNMQLSILNENLVLRYIDNGKEKISFYGNQKVVESINQIFHEFKNISDFKIFGINASIGTLVDENKYQVIEDRDNNDYVINTTSLAVCQGKKYTSLRKFHNRFQKKYPTAALKNYKMGDEIKKEVITFIDELLISPNYEDKVILKKDSVSIDRFFQIANKIDAYVSVLYIDERIFAVFLSEFITPQYNIAHFIIANYDGIKELPSYIFVEIAKFLREKGSIYINIEQDLGIEGLRNKKMLLRPEFFVKKYTISLK